MLMPLYCRPVATHFRHGQRRLRRGSAPGLHPGHAAGLKLGDDLVGDVVVEASPVLAGARASIRV
jgi:hypothetical protein